MAFTLATELQEACIDAVTMIATGRANVRSRIHSAPHENHGDLHVEVTLKPGMSASVAVSKGGSLRFTSTVDSGEVFLGEPSHLTEDQKVQEVSRRVESFVRERSIYLRNEQGWISRLLRWTGICVHSDAHSAAPQH